MTSPSPRTAASSWSGRCCFLAQAASRMKVAPTPPACSVLVLADLAGFRRINVVIGHRAGDGVLRECAARLAKVAGDHISGRIGDDEFAVFATGFADEKTAE